MLSHLHSRHLDTDLHTVWVNDVDRVASFPLWNLAGQLTGYQSYRPDADKMQKNDEKGRYYTYRGEKLFPKHCKTVSVWGLESWYLSNTLFVFEGIFDAARVTARGYSAVATLSNDPNKSVLEWFRCVRTDRLVVAVCDPGKAGAKLAKVGHTSHTVNCQGIPDADMGGVPDDYVTEFLKDYT